MHSVGGTQPLDRLKEEQEFNCKGTTVIIFLAYNSNAIIFDQVIRKIRLQKHVII